MAENRHRTGGKDPWIDAVSAPETKLRFALGRRQMLADLAHRVTKPSIRPANHVEGGRAALRDQFDPAFHVELPHQELLARRQIVDRRPVEQPTEAAAQCEGGPDRQHDKKGRG